MEPAPVLVPAPAIVEDRAKPVVIRPPEVNGAHDYAVIGYLLTQIMFIPWFVIVLTIGSFGLLASPYLPYAITLPPALPAWLTSIPLIGPILIILTFPGVGLAPSWFVYLGVGLGGLLAALIFLGFVYFGTVRSINKGRYEKARASALFFAVLFIIPVFLVLVGPTLFFPTTILLLPVFFFFMTYGRLGEVIAKYGPVAVLGEAVPGVAMAAPPGGPVPMMGGPMGGPVPPVPGVIPGHPVMAPKVPLCPTCGRELYYSANHRRWYCQNCDNPTGHR